MRYADSGMTAVTEFRWQRPVISQTGGANVVAVFRQALSMTSLADLLIASGLEYARWSLRWFGFDDKTISLYARGMTVREIQAHLEEMYGTEVSPSLISSVTDAVLTKSKHGKPGH